MNGTMTAITCAIAVAMLTIGSGAAVAAETTFEGEVRLGAATSDNALRLASGEKSATYVPFGLRLDLLRGDLDRGRFRLRLDYGGDRFVEDQARAADESDLALALRFDRRFGERAEGRHDIDITLGVRRTDATSLRRGTEEEIVIEESGSAVSLADRFDKDVLALGADWSWRKDRATVRGSLDLSRADYREDYRDLASIDSLDYERGRAALRLGYAIVPDRLEARLEGRLARTRYDERRPRVLDGALADGQTVELREREARAQVRLTPRVASRVFDRVAFGAEYRWQDREDTFAGYLDRERTGWRFEAATRLPKRVTVRFEAALDDSRYPNIVLDDVAQAPRFTIDQRELELVAALPLHDVLALEVAVRDTRSSSSDPLWSYDERALEAVLVWSFDREVGGGRMDEE